MRLGCPEELLCVGNFALISESLEGSKRKRKAWKGARINLNKTNSGNSNNNDNNDSKITG